MKKIIVTGATGMIGEGVLHECLKNPDVESVLMVNRKPSGVKHERLDELVVDDFLKLSKFGNKLAGYDACFFCAGVSSVGKKEDAYKKVTYDLTMSFAETLSRLNLGMTFCYVSGLGTDSTEKGKIMWARVKGKTENDLLKLPFKDAYMFRPGYIQPTRGLKNSYKIYKVLAPFYPILKSLFPRYVISLEELGNAMINAVLHGNSNKILECEEIRNLSH